MWNLPGPGIEPLSPALAGAFPGKSSEGILNKMFKLTSSRDIAHNLFKILVTFIFFLKLLSFYPVSIILGPEITHTHTHTHIHIYFYLF